MTAKQLIDMSCAYAGLSKAELARRLGWSPQSLSNRISTGKFTLEDWQRIADAVGADIHMRFVFSDGKIIET